jgi:hypothetical protein
MEIYISNLKKIAGDGILFTESIKSVAKRDKQYFIDLVDTLSQIDDRSLEMEDLGVNLALYELPYIQIIETLLLREYGPLKSGLILWWCTERKMINSKTYNLIDENGKGTIVSNTGQLYKYIQTMK